MWDGMMGWGGSGGWGWGWFSLMHILWWVFIVLGIVAIVRWTGGGGSQGSAPKEQDRALAILRERYARGEISKAEFDERKRDLAG